MYGRIRSYSIASNAENPGITFGAFCTEKPKCNGSQILARAILHSTISTSNESDSSRVTVTPDRAMPNPWAGAATRYPKTRYAKSMGQGQQRTHTRRSYGFTSRPIRSLTMEVRVPYVKKDVPAYGIMPPRVGPRPRYKVRRPAVKEIQLLLLKRLKLAEPNKQMRFG
jgi:hypothetical protein